MTTELGIGPSPHAVQVFAALRRRNNVLLKGPPGTGKTRLLSEVAKWFEQAPGVGFDSQGDVPFPQSSESVQLPSPERTERKTFRMVFHPGTRYRHLLRELEPVPNNPGTFRYSRGVLFEANEHAIRPGGTALVIIDEINRGPAVEAFGDAVVAIEADKRLDESDDPTDHSVPILLPHDNGERKDYFLSSHLYILAAMNAADASVAPIDVAFLRRWEPIDLVPDVNVVREALNLPAYSGSNDPIGELLGAFVYAWQRVNDRITLLRGKEYQVGHAVAIPEAGRDFPNIELAVAFVSERWSQLEQHVGELFFGDPRREVAALAGGSEASYACEESYIGSELTVRVVRPNPYTAEDWTDLLRAVASSGG